MKRGCESSGRHTQKRTREIKGLEVSVASLVETGHPLKRCARVFEKISER